MSDRCEVLVIGSGAGGAVVAATMAEAGRDVILVEEGIAAAPDIETHTPEGLRRMYRHGGLFPLLGQPPIAFGEGRCYGGGTELNSAFWHRAPAGTISRWVNGATGLRPGELERLYDELEAVLQISKEPTPNPPPGSRRLLEGAGKLGWEVKEVPRAQTRNDQNPYCGGTRRSMSCTYLPRAQRAGARVLMGTSARRLEISENRVVAVKLKGREGLDRVQCSQVFVCAGAISTPRLLRASGVTRGIGDTLRVHPMVKIAARFEEILDAHKHPLPFYQVTEFWPDLTLGGSVFTAGHLAVTLAAGGHDWQPLRHWRQMGLYYAAIAPRAVGRVRAWPWNDEALVLYSLSRSDIDLLYTGLERLCQLLLAAGARCLFPGVKGVKAIDGPRTFAGLPGRALSLSAVHAFGSCPLGQATDTSGKVPGLENLWLGDASLFPDSPGVNPQATVMALALRSARRFLS